MFDVGFSELLFCFLIALLVLGPERLPRLARTVGRWTGRARSYLRNLTAELDREAQVSELKQQLEDARQALRTETRSLDESARKLLDDTRKP